ncbi:MAG: tRNA pseudouridine(54/55) synthase Pus10 [Halococcoides sp.]
MNVLAIARDALSTGPLCNACLGRLVADRSHGLANHERGRALRRTIALADDEPIETDREECWVCEGESDRSKTFAERAATAITADVETFQVGTRVPPLLEENDRLLREEVGLDPEAGEALKTDLNREVGKRLGERIDAAVDFERPDVQVTLDLADDSVDVQVNSAFVYGRYRKLERDIPQTRWPCSACGASGRQRGSDCPECGGSGYRYDRSVEQLTAPVVREAMDGESATFHGAGREDVDARMLGTGRPFVIEVEEPTRRTVDTDTLVDDIADFADGAVEVRDLALATYEMVARVKELDASKTYRMDVEFDEPVASDDLAAALDALAGATIEQRTPHRVDHRRADTVRTRKVYAADGSMTDDRTADIEIHGAGGLYVKELVSSDEGRTEPSLAGELGVPARVTALDVLAVDGEDEPFADPEYLREPLDESATVSDGPARPDP